MSRILELKIRNVKRIAVLDITPEGHLVVIGGENGAGKTSVLDAIMYALGGASAIPSRPLRDGQERGEVEVTLEGGLIVKRTFTAAGGGTLTLSNEDGAKYPSPQARLDNLLGRLSFDPLEFSRMKPADQLETLRQLVGVDFTDLDADRAGLYAQRAESNRTVKIIETRLADMPKHDDAPEEPISVADLLGQMETIRALEREHDKACETLDEVNEKQDEAAERRGKAAEQIEKWQAKLFEADADLARGDEAIKQARVTVERKAAALEDRPIGPLVDQISSAEETNQKLFANRARAEVVEDLEMQRNVSISLTNEINQVDREKAQAVELAEFPIAGLAFGTDGVLYKDLPFEQASGAEQLRVSCAMGFALNPDLRILLVRDGSLLDKDSLRLLSDMAENADAQVWLERVGDGEECSVVIEDGMVRG